MPLSSKPSPPTRAKGRQSVREPISAIGAKRTAERLLRDNRVRSPMREVLQALSVAGVLTLKQLQYLTGIADRTLRKYYSQHWIDYPKPPAEHLPIMGWNLDTPEPERRVYALGAVGHELVQQMGPPDARYPSGSDYAGWGANQIMHDLAVATTAIGLRQVAERGGMVHRWLSRYESTFTWNDKAILEPDSLIFLNEGKGEAICFAIEHHNEDAGRRAAEKVQRYERVAKLGHFNTMRLVGNAPIVLITYLYDAVLDGYVGALHGQEVRCRYFARSFRSLRQQEDYARWLELPSKKEIAFGG